MDSYSLTWKPSAVRELRKLPRPIIARLVARIEDLQHNPYTQGATKMTAMENTWRIRDGDYRVIYKVAGNALTVEIIRIGNRRDVYR